MSFLPYQDVYPYAKAIKTAALARKMPGALSAALIVRLCDMKALDATGLHALEVFPDRWQTSAERCCSGERAISLRGFFRRPTLSSTLGVEASPLTLRPLCSEPPKSAQHSEAWVRKRTFSATRCKTAQRALHSKFCASSMLPEPL